MRTRFAVMASIAILSLTVVGITWTSVGSTAYNSEEHKLIADRGVANVKIPASVKLPDGVEFKPQDTTTYVAGMKNSKLLAVGVGTNAEDWKNGSPGVQDNCYWSRPVNSFKQSDYNQKIWIPPATAAPKAVLLVRGYATATLSRMFTVGELVAFYGDYRKIPYCDGGTCYVTDGDVREVKFIQQFENRPFDKTKYCPADLPPTDYIMRIASGLVPPFGTFGNARSNTAKSSTNYSDAGWWGDEMLRIANINDWHFSNVAVAWYIGMHRLALVYADSARTNAAYWQKALHYEANALHSLTDLFAFGHVVTNSDEASHGIVKGTKVDGLPTYQWMSNVIAMGGGTRNTTTGLVTLSSTLPAVTDLVAPRNSSLATNASVISSDLSMKKVGEMVYHDRFNRLGATVKNLRGDRFTIKGDGGLRNMTASSVEVAANAVTASVQSLFDAYDALLAGNTSVEQLAAAGSSYFAALQYLPVYIDSAGSNFKGQYASYAQLVNEISGARKTLPRWPQCRIPFLSGKDIPAVVAVPAAKSETVANQYIDRTVTQPSRCVAF